MTSRTIKMSHFATSKGDFVVPAATPPPLPLHIRPSDNTAL